jgi:hypothetical protein
VPSITRRTLLRTGVTVGTVAVPVVWAGSAQAAPVRRVAGRPGAAVARRQPVAWTRANFAPHRGKSFTVSGHGHKVQVVLATIDNLTGSRHEMAQHQFSLLFQAHRSVNLPAGIYTLRGAKFQALSIYLTPVDRGRKAQYLQAVVNRLG